MTASTPSTISRYRPAILFLTGVSAGYAAYVIYNSLQSSGPGDGLHRSNAVRRRRPRDSPVAPALPLNDHDIPVLGQYDVLGTQVLFDPHNLITPAVLRNVILGAEPDASEEVINNVTETAYEEFFDRLLVLQSPDRALSPSQVNALHAWLNDRNPNNSALSRDALARAAARHAQIFVHMDNLALDGAESVAPTELSLGSDDDHDDDAIDPEGQTLQRTLYHIAEDRARIEGVIHRGITCNACDEKPIRGTRWHCANCPDFDLCSNCEATNSHYKNHIFYKIRVPAGYLSLQKQEPIYPGKPHMMNLSIDPALKRRLLPETKMEAEEIEALWDQFTCLAGTEWFEDPAGVCWAIDRRDFNHAFVPRYNGFVARPNLVYDRIFAYYDTDKNGLIGFEEWIKGLDGMHTTDSEVKAKIVFDGYDIDGDGYISRKDILRIFRAYYSIEKEATRNYIMELSEEVTVRSAMDTIRSSQPLGSAFPPRSMNASNASNPRLQQKQENGANATPPIVDRDADVAEREEILRTTDVHHIEPDEISEEQQASILNRRWARRRYYLDEEEGFTRPDGADAQSDPDEPADPSEERFRNRGSRSSSRVRFQDDVELETRSNASSSRPFGERWGGYEIPEPEQDLGKEVLYQVTQQGFNELLNPLFLEKEDMAMDAHETRGERRTHAGAIESMTTWLFTVGKADVEAILHVGIFRFSKCMVDKFCRALNGEQWHLERICRDPNHGRPRTEKEARAAIEQAYDSIESKVLSSVKNPKATNADNLTIWNMFLCKCQLREEAINAVLACADEKGLLSHQASGKGPAVEYKDPTMPQFRPDSLAYSPTNAQAGSCSSSESGAASDTDESSLSALEDADLERCFFVCASSDGLERYPGRQRFTNGTVASEPGSPPTPAAAVVLAEQSAETEPSSPPAEPRQEEAKEENFAVNWRWYTDVPEFHHLFTHNSEGVDVIQCASNQTNHSTDPYHPETHQLRPLQRSIRQIAMNPKSPLHLIMLASLESVEQEMHDRKGGGLVNFEEFAEHLRQGQLRFLESWMDWRYPYIPKKVVPRKSMYRYHLTEPEEFEPEEFEFEESEPTRPNSVTGSPPRRSLVTLFNTFWNTPPQITYQSRQSQDST